MLLHPSEIASELIGASAARRSPALQATGEGVTVTDIDSGVDILHPALFRADGGFYAWIDVDEDGAFTPGVDGVDLDRDGSLEDNEVLRVIEAVAVRDGEVAEPAGETFRARKDWLYLDRNRDRERNAGPEQGFFESDPAYGEPLFVADDVDGDGALDVGEKLVRLSTSKVERYITDGEEFVRGEDLIASVLSPGYQRAFHGTGVAGALLGGQAGYHDRVGVAPGAELVMVGLTSEVERTSPLQSGYGNHIMAIEEATRRGTDILLHEWSDPFTQPLDGTTLLEEVMVATANASDVLHIKPVGNLNGSNKHIEEVVLPDELTSMPFLIEEGAGEGPGFFALVGSLQWRGDGGGELDIELVSPGTPEDRVALVTGGERVQESHKVGQDFITVTLEETSAGTHLLRFYIFSAAADIALAAGRWSFEIAGATGALEMIGRVSDYQTTWNGGVGWVRPGGERYTLSFPSAAATGIAVGSYSGRYPSGNAPLGSLRDYSGRGTSFDGRVLDGLIAPDDAFAPLALTDRIAELGARAGYYVLFGGTSGAAAHVAGAAALFFEAEKQRPRPRPIQEVVAALILPEHVQRDGIEDVTSWPDPGWLSGKVDIYAALTGGARQPSLTMLPQISLVTTTMDGEDEDEVRFEVVVDDPEYGGDLEYRFDLGYDGAFDTEWREDASASVTRSNLPEPGEGVFWVKAVARDSAGQQVGALLPYDPFAIDTMDGSSMDADDMGGGSGGRKMMCFCRTAPSSDASASRSGSHRGALGLFLGLLLLGSRRRRSRARVRVR